MSKYTSVLKKLKQYNIKIKMEDEENEIVYCKGCIISISKEDGSILLSFNVSTLPDEASVLCMIMKEVRSFGTKSNVFIGENYFVYRNIIYYGEEAHKMCENYRREQIIKMYERKKEEDIIFEDDNNAFYC